MIEKFFAFRQTLPIVYIFLVSGLFSYLEHALIETKV